MRQPSEKHRAASRNILRILRDRARDSIVTEPDHSIRHHRADEFLRDLLEEVLHESES